MSLAPFRNFGLRQVHWLGAFIVTVTLNSLVKISDYLIGNSSKVVAAPAKHQLANGLVGSQ
jgi:hypothetical protein